jgi:hypothetical protein
MTPSGTGGARKRTPKPRPDDRLMLASNGDDVVSAMWRIYRWRFLFANGDVLDVVSTHDDSHLRGELLKLRGVTDDRIVGVSEPVPIGWTADVLDQ